MKRARLSLVALLVLFGALRTAAAQSITYGGVSQSGRIDATAPLRPQNEIYAVPESGMEFGRFSRAIFRPSTFELKNFPYAMGVAGLSVGVRRGLVNAGVRYQGTYVPAGKMSNATVQRVYADVGLNWHGDAWNVNLFADFGWAIMHSDAFTSNGVGAKVGAAFDIYLARWLSLGPVLSFDVEGLNTGAAGYGWVNVLAGSALIRVGLHI